MSRGRDLTPLREVLAGLTGLIGFERPLEAAELWRKWPEIVGESLAAHAEPSLLKRGVLKVWADSAVWATEIGYMAPQLREKINGALGEAVVLEVQVFTGPAPARMAARERSRRVAADPRATGPTGASNEDPATVLERARAAWSRVHDRGR